VVPTPTAAVAFVTSAGAEDAKEIPGSGVDQAARVLDEAVRTCPALGAVAAEMMTIVVAVLKPEAVLSSERRESFPWQKVPEVDP